MDPVQARVISSGRLVPEMTRKMTKAEAGRLGGLRTVQKYGRSHMSKIGKKGADALYKKYRLVPFGVGDYALVCKCCDGITALHSGKSFICTCNNPVPELVD